jgi:hypothetical protein
MEIGTAKSIAKTRIIEVEIRMGAIPPSNPKFLGEENKNSKLSD